jgi:histidinol phosphatase-like enzyme (inositol monophosphatase family)
VTSADLDRIGGRAALDDLVGEVLAAGNDALRMYLGGAGERATKKSDRSPVTEADHAVEVRLRAYVTRRYPKAAFVGEETGASEGDAALRFVVDPIDGTRAFLRGIPSWSVLVAVAIDGVPAIGIAYMPAQDDLFVGALGHGAYVNGRPVRLSSTQRLTDAVVSHGALGQFTDAGRESDLVRLARATYTQRGFADFEGYKQLLLGRVDAVIEPSIREWDVMPAAVLIRAAGGRMTAYDGTDALDTGHVVSSNGLVHDALLELLRA